MAAVVIWSADLAKRMAYKPRNVRITGFQFSMTVDKPVSDFLEKDEGPRQQHAMVDDANKAMAKAVKEVEASVKLLDSIASGEHGSGNKDVAQVLADCQRAITRSCQELYDELNEIPKRRWELWLKVRKDYRNYKLKSAGKMVIGSLSLVANLASAAGSVLTAGVTLALSLVGMTRASVAVGNVLVKLWEEAEQVQKRLIANADKVKGLYETKGKQALGRRSTGMAAINALLGSDVAPSLKAMESDCQLWLDKLNGIDLAAGKSAQVAVKGLTDAEKLETSLKTVKAKALSRALDNLVELRQTIHQNLESCHAQSQRCNNGRELHQIYAAIVKDLRSAQPTWSTVCDKLIPAAASLAYAGANAAHGLQQASSALQATKQTVVMAARVADIVQKLGG